MQSEYGPIDANLNISIGDAANLDDAIAVGSVTKEQGEYIAYIWP